MLKRTFLQLSYDDERKDQQGQDGTRHTAQKNKVFHYGFLQETADLVTFTEEICDGKLHFLCSDINNAIRAIRGVLM